ncbi:MAG: sigma-70 family RNA polymerase sigma factor [Clostridia bacterium]|nr:sigma-70 family RNA polymerase sigma factor [Clostridia bacterium]
MDRQALAKVNQCIDRIKSGEGRAPIEDLYALLGNSIRFAALRYLGDTPEAEDVVQDFWLHIEGICAKCALTFNGYGFLRKAFDNLCRDRLRSLARAPQGVDTEVLDAYDGGGDPELTVRQQALKESFAKAQSKMNEEERKVFALVCYEEMSVRDIAKVLDMSKSQVARIRKSMTDILKAVLIEDGWDTSGD